MAQTDFLPPDDSNRPAPVLRAAVDAPPIAEEIKDESVFASLIANFRDAFFAPRLPPLVLESTPIAVADPMKTQMSKKSVALSITFYVLLFLLFAWLIRNHVQITAPPSKQAVALLAPVPPPIAPKKTAIGGGGGQHDLSPVTQGHLPKLVQEQIVPPKAPPTIAPKLAVEPSVVVQKDLKMADMKAPDIGAPNSTLKGFSMGNGNGTGIGSGNGPGIGPGNDGNTGGGYYHVGGGVSSPKLVLQPEAEFTEEARKAKFQGNVEVYLIVDEKGNPTHVRVARDAGMGLGDKAVEAVRQYKFKPAMKDGKPVKVDMYIDVNFQIF